ncbi:M28 family peptidase [Flavobacteriaceae bacterium XHP0103]|uniref:M28 family metallopeptidase n=1 Tax=Marixanthotalea marina TaxID=2844359 RepID=UPI002989D959|nr:M28 family metallopeptidase [Marixanthotalea marina]MBU3821552.1 M28 family peptidase [Marixanthotalea marina]
MKKIALLLSLVLLFANCGTSQNVKSQKPLTAANFAELIRANDLKEMLYIYASDEFEGRRTGEPGQKKAIEFLKDHYIKWGIPSPISKGDYFQEIPESFFKGKAKASENVMAFIKGSEKPDEVLVISGHLDHEGIKNGKIYNGADDDGSGTVAILEIAKAFKTAADNDYAPKRSILFLHFTGEELGLYGSKYYTEVDPVIPLENTIADLNIDMIGRTDPKHDSNSNYMYLIGSNRLSTELHDVSEAVNKEHFNMVFDYTFNDENDPNRYYYRSDHYNFAKNNIPVIFYFDGGHEDYHKPTDTPDKIDYDLLTKRTQLIFYTAWELANREERVKLD